MMVDSAKKSFPVVSEGHMKKCFWAAVKSFYEVRYRENKHEQNFKMSQYPFEKLGLGENKQLHHSVGAR